MSEYGDIKKVVWYDEVVCPGCGGKVNSWDKRISRALKYKSIICEKCIGKEYGVTVDELRDTMQNHFGLVPCPGII